MVRVVQLKLFIPNRKGQVSFEFIIVLAVVVLFSSIIMLDTVNESRDTSVLASVKNTAANQVSLNVLRKTGCVGSYFDGISFSDSTIELKFTGPAECRPTATEIANIVESTTCSVEADGDEKISCGGNTYIVKIV